MHDRFSGQTVVVTGGGSGIGAAACALFGAEGADVVIVDKDVASARSVANSLRQQGSEAFALECDLADEDAVVATIAAIGERRERIDVLFGNAGMPCPEGIEALATSRWDETFAVNARAQYFLVRHGLPLLERGEGRAVVLTASAAGLVAMGSQPAYSASKGAVVALTRALASELMPKRIRVNCLCPGWVRTPMVERFYAQQYHDTDARHEALRAAAISQPMGRYAEPHEIAAAAAFLASSDASYITGIALPVDGGLTSISTP